MIRKSTGEYPVNWKEIAKAVKDAAGWKCIRCEHTHDIEGGYMLTVHHLDLNKSNCAWWNIVALCQKCHLQIQHKVVMEQPYMFPHSEWFKPYVAAYYGVVECVFEMTLDYYESLKTVPVETVQARMDELLILGLGMTPIPGTDHFEEAW
jgi:hypothetical protein